MNHQKHQDASLSGKEANSEPEALPKRAQYRLPFKEDIKVSNFNRHPLSMLLTDSIYPWLQQRHPGGRYVIGKESFIYYRLQNPFEEKAQAPHWFCIVDVSPTLDGKPRLSYVLWEELIPPSIVLEFVTDDSAEKRDRTPRTGKFWAYEQAIQAPFYGIFDQHQASLEAYALEGGNYRQMTPNAMGRYPVTPLGLELGIWHGKFFAVNLPWLRWWDADRGTMLPTGREEAEIAEQLADEAQQQRLEAEQLANEAKQLANEAKRQRLEAKQHLEKMKDKLRSLGIDPDTL